MRTMHCSFPLFKNFSTEQVEFTMLFDDNGEIGNGCHVSIVLQGTTGIQNFIESTITGIRSYAISSQLCENIFMEEKIAPENIAWYLYYSDGLVKRKDTLSRIRPTWHKVTKHYGEPIDWHVETTKVERAFILGLYETQNFNN